jgi:hypothetical protein
MKYALAVVVVALICNSPVRAQVTIQQPVVGSMRVGTSVSVPDRGTTFIGGVNSAASSRSSNGPVRTGTTRTSSVTSSSVTARVHIIDLNEMDEAILNSVADAPASMTMRYRDATSSRDAVPSDTTSAAEKVVKFEGLARKAEAAGKSSVAKLHWQMAARHGSTLAQAKLNPVSATAPSTATAESSPKK